MGMGGKEGDGVTASHLLRLHILGLMQGGFSSVHLVLRAQTHPHTRRHRETIIVTEGQGKKENPGL